MEEILKVLPWIGILLVSTSYWFQIYKIHIHKEVRDLSISYYVFLALGFSTLIYQAYADDSIVFLVKQIGTLIPVLIILFQIWYHREDHWHDEEDPICSNCGKELEPHWSYCSYCGTKKKD